MTGSNNHGTNGADCPSCTFLGNPFPPKLTALRVSGRLRSARVSRGCGGGASRSSSSRPGRTSPPATRVRTIFLPESICISSFVLSVARRLVLSAFGWAGKMTVINNELEQYMKQANPKTHALG
jgi:hypothetical protein